MLRYALLRHECPADYRDGPHWDLMLELPGVADERRLATWSLLSLPAAWAEALSLEIASADEPAATRLDDHRVAYLDYEGPVSGGRGDVRCVAGGPIEWLTTQPRRMEARLCEPSSLAGVLCLSKAEEEAAWRLRWRRGEC